MLQNTPDEAQHTQRAAITDNFGKVQFNTGRWLILPVLHNINQKGAVFSN